MSATITAAMVTFDVNLTSPDIPPLWAPAWSSSTRIGPGVWQAGGDTECDPIWRSWRPEVDPGPRSRSEPTVNPYAEERSNAGSMPWHMEFSE